MFLKKSFTAAIVMTRVLIIWLSLVGCAYSLITFDCLTMEPGSGSVAAFQAANGDKRYNIASACYVIFPSDPMRIRVWDRESIGTFKGVVMQVRKTSNQAISGAFSNPLVRMKTMTCTSPNDGATNRNNISKVDTDTEILWTAPATCKKNEEYEIRATVAQDANKWHKIVIPLVCDPDYDNIDVMERVRPPLKVQYCAVGNWATIPKGATDSFEERLGAGGWRHFYGAPGFRFERRMGPTPSANTGPPSAQDGNYYLYYEATGRRENDMAGLLSPFPIQGCFCFSFYCHMNTDGKTEFSLSLIGQVQRNILTTTEVTNYWRRVTYSFISEKPLVFAFQVFSSGDDRGDVGLDNIEVTPGPCDNSVDGYAGLITIQ